MNIDQTRGRGHDQMRGVRPTRTPLGRRAFSVCGPAAGTLKCRTRTCRTGICRIKCQGRKMWDWIMRDWKMKDHGYFSRNVVSMLCMSRCTLSGKLFSRGIQINSIFHSILFKSGNVAHTHRHIHTDMLLRFYFIAIFTCFQFCG